MADARTFAVQDSTGAPLTGGAAGMSALARDVTGAVRTAPTVTELGGGLYQVLPTDADEAAGTVVLVDCGAGNEPRRVALECYRADRSNQFWAIVVEDLALELWTGAAPTVTAYVDKAGAARTPPTLVPVAGAYLFVAVPSSADVTADTSIFITGPAGSAQPSWSDDTKPLVVSPWAAPSSGPLLDPAFDVVQFLDTKTAGAVVLAQGSNLFIGEVRSSERASSPAVFALNTGGPAPEPYLGGRRTALFRPTVQLIIRGPADDKQAGEALARGVFAWLHQRVLDPYVSWFARDSAPAYLGTDSGQHGQWSINLECVYRASLG